MRRFPPVYPKRYGELLQRGTVINGIKSGEIEFFFKLVYNQCCQMYIP